MNTTVYDSNGYLAEATEDAKKFFNLKMQKEFLKERANCCCVLYEAIITDKATPDLTLTAFLDESVPNWIELLTRELVILILSYPQNPTDENKTKIQELTRELANTTESEKTKIGREMAKFRMKMQEDNKALAITAKALQDELQELQAKIATIYSAIEIRKNI